MSGGCRNSSGCVCVCVCESQSFLPYEHNGYMTHMLLHHSRDEWPIQQPVVHRLVLEGDTADMPPTIHIPGSNTHSELLRGGEVTPAVTNVLLERNGACVCMYCACMRFVCILCVHVFSM